MSARDTGRNQGMLNQVLIFSINCFTFVGASHHREIFMPTSGGRGSSRPEEKKEIEDDFSPHIQDTKLHDTYGAGDYQQDPLQLEHTVGYGGEYSNNLWSLPLSESSFVKG